MIVKVITPEKQIFNEDAKSVNLPTLAGEITIFPNHTEILSVINPGRIRIEFDSGKREFLSEGGVVEVFKNEVSLLLRKYEERV
ncbi:MAG: F0F1 ATP synthase subunit epsilon [Candidatus Pacebacteria bacterium]|nr:F0F1 ATP synthase subunit epsilon [Candidatus Paceibacterota bacterium]